MIRQAELSPTPTVTVSLSKVYEVKGKNKIKAKVLFPEVVFKKIQALVEACPKEVAWHYTMVRGSSPHTYMIQDVLVFPQEVSGVHATSNDELYPKWVDELPTPVYNNLRGHGHSHVHMGVGASPTDEAHYEDLTKHEKDFYFMHITNKTGKHEARLIDVANNIIFFDKDIELVLPKSNDFSDWAEQQLKDMVVAPVTTRTSWPTEFTGGVFDGRY